MAISVWEKIGQAFCLGVYGAVMAFGFLLVAFLLVGLFGFVLNFFAALRRHNGGDGNDAV